MNTNNAPKEQAVSVLDAGMSPSELGRALAASRRRVAGECAVCGKPIQGVQRNGELYRLYCSSRCSKRAYRARKKLAGTASEEAGNSGD